MKGFKLLMCMLFLATAGMAQPNLDVLPYWKFYQPNVSHTYHQLMEQTLEQLAERNSRVAAIETAADWEDYRTRLHAQFVEAVGAFPERTPLEARITSTVEVDGVIAENLLYQSMPGYYVSATFFKKKALSGEQLPVIVYASGHSELAYRNADYQHMILNYVKKGFAVLAFDPVGQGERIQYRHADGRPAMGPTHDHSYSGSKSFLLGHSPARYFIWDGIRAIDYLETRTDVDMNRLGIAGRSGGGTQSAYIAAVDDRVVAAAPECYITTYELLLKSRGPQDAEQILLGGIEKGIDIPDLLHMRAPKPTLVVATTNDIFSIQGTHDIATELTQLYQMLGKGNDFLMVEDNAGHESTRLNREACYRFFAMHLDNPCELHDEPVTLFSKEQLYATATGDVFELPGSKKLEEIIAEESWTVPSTVSVEQLAKVLNYTPAEQGGEAIFSGTVIKLNYQVDKYLVKTQSDDNIPTLVYRTLDQKPTAVALLLDDKGKAADSTLILNLLDKYGCVVSADLSGIGELKGYYNWQGDAYVQETPLNLWFLALLSGQTLTQYRMAEIDALVHFVGKYFAYQNIVGVASGATTTDMLYWTTVNPQKLDSITLLAPLISFKDIVEVENYQTAYLLGAPGGVLQTYDLPDLVKRHPRGRIRLVNPVGADGEPLTRDVAIFGNRFLPESLVFVPDVKDAL